MAVLHDAAAAWIAALPDRDRAALPRRLRRAGLAALIFAVPAADAAPWARAGIACYATRTPAHRAAWALREAALELAPAATLPGVLVRVFGLGVFIAGAAGAGKSRLALELVARGHALVADDAVELRSPACGVLLGRAPGLLRGLLAVRGAGVLDLRRLFGRRAPAEQRVDLLVRLGRPAPVQPGAGPRARVHGVVLPVLSLPRRLGHNPALMIEAACRDRWLQLHGHDTGARFARRQERQLRP
ncbi:MAG TPA: hypothetical protein VM369_05245 [Candidatus Binatia bacterium]|nr:hypothetical protein [Candidatus Binatia bacterium]